MCFHVLRKNGSWDVAVVLSWWQYLKIDLASAPNSVVPRAGRVIRVSRPHSHPPSTALALVARAPLLARLVTPTTICVLCERSKGEKRRTYNPFKKKLHKEFSKSSTLRWSDVLHWRTPTDCAGALTRTIIIFYLNRPLQEPNIVFS